MLARKLHTKVSIKHIRVDFVNRLVIEGLYIQDRQGDTLLYTGETQVNISDWFFLRKDIPVIRNVNLHNAYINLNRTRQSNVWNFQFITDAFETKGKKDTSVKKKEFEIDLKKIDFVNVRFHVTDAWGGSDMNYDIGSLNLTANNIDFKKKIINLENITIGSTAIILKDYIGGNVIMKRVRHAPVIDTTPFNPDKWNIKLNKLSLKDCIFNLTGSDIPPVPGEFDPDHLYIKNINIAANKIDIIGDTIHGYINNLTATDRCGITIKKMKAKVTVSPNESVCDSLYLETNNSKLHHYYAMRYNRFPDFTSYIDSVIMEVHLKDAVADVRDIAFFAPLLKKYPSLLHVSGDAIGTVAKLVGKNLDISDGTTVFKGNLGMTGLPDIYNTYITYTNGAILTTGAGFLRYAPELKNNPNIDIESIKYAYFYGNYTGYIQNFAVKGTLTTNLGTISSDMKMNLPESVSKNASYSGTASSANFNIGTLLRQPDMGTITFNAAVNGLAFDPEKAQIKIDANVKEFDYRGYPYQNITVQGILARRQFKGKMLVNDTNIALAFYGDLDFSQKNIVINATANLLKSDFKALHLTNDSVNAVADFDLNCTGSDIDNFSGYAKLYNIDIKRNQHRLNLDSIYVNSVIDSGAKKLTIQSNDIVATISGDYHLSKLPYSVQYYLSGYLPNYIKTPTKFAPEQNLDFTIKTTRIDSLLGVIFPTVQNFDNSVISGSLSTTKPKLSLHVKVPQGSIGNVHMDNININGDGDFKLLELNTSIDKVTIGDSVVSGSLSVTATLGNDSLQFNVATSSSDGNSSVSLNGDAYAHKDSLFFSLKPSEFYLNQQKWEIANGSHITYSSDYLFIKDLFLQSGLQKISIGSQYELNDQTISINTENLDLGQLSNWAGVTAYQPDGRLNGQVTVKDIFKKIYITSDLKATGIKLGADTIGNIILKGNYNGSRKLVSLSPETGIYRGNSSLIVSGDMSFDSTTNNNIKGKIQFNNAPASWSSIFLTGFMSHLSGYINGDIDIAGKSYAPEINGNINLANIGMRIDFLGTYYRIPQAVVKIDNKKIDIGSVTIYDSLKNTATLSGYFAHNHFSNITMRLSIASPKFEVFNLKEYENAIFYGDLIAGFNPLTIRGPFNNISININDAAPAAKSNIFIPIQSSSSGGNYSFVTFKTYGKTQEAAKPISKSKLNLVIDAHLNDMATVTLVMDPATGDAITARGNGDIRMELPANNDLRMFGKYSIDDGDYSLSFRQQLTFRRKFLLNTGSSITFNGPIGQTDMDVNATYTTHTRLYNLLSDQEKQADFLGAEIADAKIAQDVNVILHMKGTLSTPKLTFNIELPDRRSVGTFAYTKLERLNLDDRQLFNQVAALLIIGDFISPDGAASSAAFSGVINNASQMLSSAVSSQLTNMVNKILGNKDLSIDLKYTNYNFNANQVSLGIRKNYFHDRLIVEIGSTSDWGRPTNTSNTTNFNLAGDFRVQYLLTESGALRLNGFRTNDYDVTLNQNIARSGVGISWRKSFDGFNDFFHSANYKSLKNDINIPVPSDSSKKDTDTTL